MHVSSVHVMCPLTKAKCYWTYPGTYHSGETTICLGKFMHYDIYRMEVGGGGV